MVHFTIYFLKINKEVERRMQQTSNLLRLLGGIREKKGESVGDYTTPHWETDKNKVEWIGW